MYLSVVGGLHGRHSKTKETNLSCNAMYLNWSTVVFKTPLIDNDLVLFEYTRPTAINMPHCVPFGPKHKVVPHWIFRKERGKKMLTIGREHHKEHSSGLA